MFDRFTDKAKKSLNLARMAAQEFGCEHIAPEHMLHGLLRVGECGASRILVNLKVDPGALLEGLRKRMRRAAFHGSAQLPFTPGTKQSLMKAMEAAQTAAHDYIGTEHLLVGLSECGPDLVTDVLLEHDLGAKVLLHELLECDGPPKRKEERQLTLEWAADIARQLGDDDTARRIEALIQRLPS